MSTKPKQSKPALVASITPVPFEPITLEGDVAAAIAAASAERERHGRAHATAAAAAQVAAAQAAERDIELGFLVADALDAHGKSPADFEVQVEGKTARIVARKKS